MNMGVRQSGNEGDASSVDDVGSWSACGADGVVVARGDDESILDGDGRAEWLPVIEGANTGTPDNQIGIAGHTFPCVSIRMDRTVKPSCAEVV